MQITLKFRDTDARSVKYYLQKRHSSKVNMEKLCLLAIRREVAKEAKKELDEIGK